MFKKIKENKMFVVSIIAILFIPVLYAANFLIAFADPYNNLSSVPVAIVNDDNGTTYNSEDINIGDEFVQSLKESNNFKWYFVTDDEALDGMKDSKYYFTVKIPDNFSENVYSTLTGDAKSSDLIYMANDNKNYICGVLGNALVNELESQLNKKIVSTFVSNLNSNLVDGGTQLSTAVNQILNGSSEVTTNLASLVSGSKELLDSTKKLNEATITLSTGVNTLSTSYTKFNSSLGTVSQSLNQINTGYKTLNTSISTYKDSLIAALEASNLPEATKQALIDNYNSINQNSAYLSNSLNTVNTGVSTLSYSSNQISTSLKDVSTGVTTISGYLEALESGAEKIYNGASLLYSGSSTLNSGITQLSSGINTFNTSVTSLNLEKNASSVAAPVTRVDEAYSAVDNYGYGFAPYFISLGLFVGALVTTIVLAMKSKKSKVKNTITHSLKKLGLFAGIVITQSVLLDIVLLLTKIKVDNILLFVAFTILIGLTFMAIVQMLTTLFNDIGRFLCIILLTLQLTACGGTFPIETAPKFYDIINPFMPMTYTVDGLRAIIGSGNMGIVGHSVIVLLSIIVVCYSLILLYFKKSKKFA